MSHSGAGPVEQLELPLFAPVHPVLVEASASLVSAVRVGGAPRADAAHPVGGEGQPSRRPARAAPTERNAVARSSLQAELGGNPGASSASSRAARPGLRLIRGGGARKQEPLASRDAVVRVLLEAGADLLLRRISPERAEHIEKRVDHVLDLFDRVDRVPELMPVLKRQLDELEALMTETRERRHSRASMAP